MIRRLRRAPPYQSDQMLALIGAEANRFVLQIVHGANQADSFALRPHQNRMGDGSCAFGFYAAQKRAVANPSRAKDDVFSVRQIIGEKDALEIFFAAISDELLALLLVAWPHFALHIAGETCDPRRREHC